MKKEVKVTFTEDQLGCPIAIVSEDSGLWAFNPGITINKTFSCDAARELYKKLIGSDYPEKKEEEENG
jgi:hypothetical protein